MNTSKKELRLELDLPYKNFRYYPYIDTFKFIDNEGILYNYIPDGVSIKTLCSTDGSKYDSDYLRFDSVDKVFRYRGESIYVDYMDFYTSERNVVWSEVNDQYILREDSFYDEEISDHIFKKDLDDKNKSEKIKARKEWLEERNKEISKKRKLDDTVREMTRSCFNVEGSSFMDVIMETMETTSIPHHYFQWRNGRTEQTEVDFSEPNNE